MSDIWRFNSGYNLGTLQERRKIELVLPLANESLNKDLSFSIIAGNLPAGLVLEKNKIVGVPLEVVRPTTSTFVIRATENREDLGPKVEDRTYELTVEGFDLPEWTTPAGPLALNGTQKLFILDNTYVDFKLSAVDRDLPAGDELEFFILDGNGKLPDGLSLYPDGSIKGIVDPILALDISAEEGFFDVVIYDAQPYDFAEQPSSGSDTYPYDTVPYGYNVKVRTPKKLNRNYQFIVTVSDGENLVNRTFNVYVVGDDFLRADNTIMRVGNGVFTSDNTYLRAPVWLTPNNLGVKRADNYVTIFLDILDANPNLGPVVYNLEEKNKDNTDSRLPDGLFLDQSNGEIFGFVPYQPAVTREHRFTITANKYDISAISQVEVAIRIYENANIGQTYLKIYPLIADDLSLILYDFLRLGNYSYQVRAYESSDPITGVPYNGFAYLRLDRSLILDIPAEFVISKIFYTTDVESSQISASKEFYISTIGEIDSVIRYLTNENLEPLRSNFPSMLSVKAETSVPRAVLSYRIVKGRLPPGLELKITGEITGKTPQFGTDDAPGLTLIDNNQTIFDGGLTTVDREYKVSILTQDQFKFSGVTKEFIIKLLDSDDRFYSSIYAKPYQRLDKRFLWQNFISDISIFSPNKIYRPSDPAYGVQDSLKMLVYPGIETTKIEKLISAFNFNAKRKRFKLSSAKKAVAKKPGTDEILYEVIYIEALDSYQNSKGTVSNKIKLNNNINSPVLINQAEYTKIKGNPGLQENINNQNIDRLNGLRPINDPLKISTNAINISGSDREYVYPATIEHMRTNLENIEIASGVEISIENEYLPLWMKTPQSRSESATGFIKAIPICYCNPGDGEYILENINNSDFDFSELDYEIDRLIVDATTENSEEQFIKFNNQHYNV
jgi:hypothetical protein